MVKNRNAGHIMQIMLTLLLFVTIINAEYLSYRNATDGEPFLRAVRRKRAPFHRYIPSSILTATIKDGDKEIYLIWKRVDRFLFNEHLPVYTAQMNSWGPTHKRLNVMKEVGETITYYDIEHKSAMIYFENMDQLHGVVGKSYAIIDLPMDALSQPLEVGGPYVKKMRRHPPHGGSNQDSATFLQQVKNRGDVKPGPSTSPVDNHQDTVSEPFYVETLILVTNDILQYAYRRYQGDYLRGLIIVYLLHFNAVDMIFAKLPTNDFEVYINIAGIILEMQDGTFSQILNYPQLIYNGQENLTVDGSLLDKISRYPNHFDFPFPRDSIDLIVVSIGRELQTYDAHFPGLAWPVDIFWNRLGHDQYKSVPTVLTTIPDVFSTYPITARYIGTILGIGLPDPQDKGISSEGLQCYGIMQMLNHHCTECLTWSEESISQLKVFFRENRNRCFLLNRPRSLHPFGIPIISISPCRQCTCFGFYSYGEETATQCPLDIQSNNCDKPLLCKYKDYDDKLDLYQSILPLDGTPCSENKVCWNEECQSIQE